MLKRQARLKKLAIKETD